MNGFMDALNALDVDRMSAYFADDITGFVPLAQADRVEGREAMTRIFRNFVARTKPTTPRLNIIPKTWKSWFPATSAWSRSMSARNHPM